MFHCLNNTLKFFSCDLVHIVTHIYLEKGLLHNKEKFTRKYIENLYPSICPFGTPNKISSCALELVLTFIICFLLVRLPHTNLNAARLKSYLCSFARKRSRETQLKTSDKCVKCTRKYLTFSFINHKFAFF